MRNYMEEYQRWLDSPALSNAEWEELNAIRDDKKEIESRFFAPLEFGTAGLRGEMALGCRRMNIHVIRHATQAFAEVIKTEGEQTGLEGCLSVPGKYGIVTRPMVVRVRAQDRYGTEFEVEDEELTARCFCHEIEHLDGHLYTEHCKVLTDEELEQYIREQEKELDEE